MVEAGTAYLLSRIQMFEAGAELQLKLAMALVPEVFAAASSTTADVGLARDVIGRLDCGWLSGRLRPLVEEALARESLDGSDYRRLAELLGDLEQAGLLELVVAQATDLAIATPAKWPMLPATAEHSSMIQLTESS